MEMNEILFYKAATDFIEAAGNFCLFIEREQAGGINFLRGAESHLLALYTLARHIPVVELVSDEEPAANLPEEELAAIHAFIGRRLPLQYYLVTLNPINITDDGVTGTGDLVDDIFDIYKDLKEALLLMGQNTASAMEHALWQCKFYFENHWGQHCIEALWAIHHYLRAAR